SSGSDDDDESGDESGEDWDELEAKAKAYDDKRVLPAESHDDHAPAKRARKR
ncbi:hypothetical protein LPJ66_008895, partial [Kickxella alabastrina]